MKSKIVIFVSLFLLINSSFLIFNCFGHWEQTSVPSNGDVNALAVSGTNIFAGTEGSGVFLSTNNGASWLNKNQGFGAIITAYSLLIANNYIFAGTRGQSVWRRPLSDIIGIQNISSEIPSAFSLEQNYPNPFNSMTKVKFQVPSSKFVKLIVFDILGKEVATLVNESLQPGTYETTFDASNIASGIYFYRLEFYRLESDNFVETRRMLMVK